MLDPEVVVHIDEAARRPGVPGEIRGVEIIQDPRRLGKLNLGVRQE